MPMIALTTTASITPTAEAALTKGLGRAIELIPGKKEVDLMISYQGGVSMAFQGAQQKSVAFLEVSCFGPFGHIDPKGCDAMTAAVCILLEETLGVYPTKTYIK